jgi:ABC-2 type transport system ATP-binding protein
MGAAPVVHTEQLTRHFGANVAVSELTLEVQPGEIFGMLGHNGAGKTTTIRLLNGLLEPTAGRLRVLGLDPATQGHVVRRHTGVLTETPSLDERLSAWDNLAFFAAMYGVPKRDRPARVQALMETFGLADRAQERVGSYSKGMRQRLALARALLHKPELLFLDEPAAGLDPVAARQLHDLIQRLSRQEGKTIFLCTHNLAEAQKLCDRVAVLQQGRLLALGAPAALAREIAPAGQLRVETDPSQMQAAAAAAGRRVELNQHEQGVLVIPGVTREQIPDLVATLVNAGIRLYRIDYAEPSLEEVYFALHAAERELG